jgi:MinD-like ATPase involved in chromosome partitioning or flagellar assembly
MNTAISAGVRTRTLLADFDLNCGSVRFALNLDSMFSVRDAVRDSFGLSRLWPHLVSQSAGIEVIHCGKPGGGFYAEPGSIQRVAEFLRYQYELTCFDLSGQLEQHSLDLMRASDRIFLVCTPHPSSLQFAREKMDYLAEHHLQDRVSIVLNRQSKRGGISVDEVERFVGAPVAFAFDEAPGEALRFNSSSRRGQQFESFAQTVLAPASAFPQNEPELVAHSGWFGASAAD